MTSWEGERERAEIPSVGVVMERVDPPLTGDDASENNAGPVDLRSETPW